MNVSAKMEEIEKMEGLAELRRRLSSASNLPSPPAVAARLIEVANDPDVGLTSVVEILRVDPALTAKLLRLANSPLYARRRQIDTLQQAVMLLGLDAVMTAALSLTLLGDGAGARSTSSVFHTQWSRSVHAAVAAQALAVHCHGVPPVDAFLAGLMQDIGVLAISRLEPHVYVAASGCGHTTLIGLEIEAMGFDHAAVGAELLASWHLPDHVVDAVRRSHDDAVDADRPLAAVIGLGGLVADSLAGDLEAMEQVRVRAAQLGIETAGLNHALDVIGDALPPLAGLLDASVPPADRLAEMAAELIMERIVRTQVASDALRSQFHEAAETASLLVEQNRLDPLTRQLNRRSLDHALDEHVEQWETLGWPFAMLFVDVDHFKDVNDTYGHRAGDEALGLVAERLTESLRHSDVVGRYGGDEFVIILPATTLAQATVVADRLVTEMRDRALRFASGAALLQTVSIGAIATDVFPAPTSKQALLDAADQALYQAKRAGRDRAVIASVVEAA